jgi:hypothetical protein
MESIKDSRILAIERNFCGRFVRLHSAWMLELRGVTGASCRETWCSRRRWRAGRVLSEHHYDHHQIGYDQHQIGGPLTFSDLRLNGGENGRECVNAVGKASIGRAK